MRTVYFSPEKRRLIENTATDEYQNIGCELLNFTKSDNGNLLITNFTSVKRVKLNFEKPSLIFSYSTVSEILNEKSMYAMINVKGTIFDLEETEQNVCKNGQTLQIRKAMFKDSTDCILITFSCNNVSKISESRCYQVTSVRVSLFQAQKILRATKTTVITEDDNFKFNVAEVESSYAKGGTKKSSQIMKEHNGIPVMLLKLPIVVPEKCKLRLSFKLVKQELPDLKLIFDVFNNRFSEATQKCKEKTTPTKSILK